MEHSFFRNWTLFFIFFGIGAISGGAGHTFINYTGLAGKVPAWAFAILSVHFIEIAMLSAHRNDVFHIFFRRISFIKLFAVSITLGLILIFSNPFRTVEYSILLVIINTLVGVVITTGVLGSYYRRTGIAEDFRHLVTGVIIMLPSSLVFLLDLNLFRWFDKNDLSHVILAVGISFFYKGIQNIISTGISFETADLKLSAIRQFSKRRR